MPMLKEQGRPLIYVCLDYFTLGQLRRVRELIKTQRAYEREIVMEKSFFEPFAQRSSETFCNTCSGNNRRRRKGVNGAYETRIRL